MSSQSNLPEPNLPAGNLAQHAAPHLNDVEAWLRDLPSVRLPADELADTAVVVVDIIGGFTRQGALASPRVAGIISPAAALLQAALNAGLPPQHIGLMGDQHPEDAEEFRAYPPHAVQGTPETQWAEELMTLELSGKFSYFAKNSIASHHTPELERWLSNMRPKTVVVMGDVTDLCLYTLALHLITRSFHHSLGQRIVVPEQCVQTWDAPDHPADFYHALFLYQLARNGVEVVRSVRFDERQRGAAGA